MIQPIKYKERVAINSLTGIKSSLPQIRSVIALTYLLYLACGRKATVEYSIQNGSQGLSLEDAYKSYIKTLLKDSSLDDTIDSNPLLKSQIESLYVGLTLMFGLGRISFVKPSYGMTIERTGGVRYPKRIDFASNMMLLDLIIQSLKEADRNSFLTAWLKNQQVSNDIELRVSIFLNICIENNLFKLRNGDKDTYFQTEGIYLALRKDNEISLESDEKVGPARILNGMLKEGLIPWLKTRNSVVNANRDLNFDIDAFCKITSTSLDIRDIKVDVKEELLNDENNDEEEIETYPLQQIFYGAPGTGKSHRIKNNEKVKAAEDKNLVFRTTFHPDSDYSTFVGAYKPTMDKKAVRNVAGDVVKDTEKNEVYEDCITYSFVPQAFLQAYVAAWNHQGENVFLVIEEINRGNCAQIFGDLFQLLDRDDEGYSEYPIKADIDLVRYLEDGKDEGGQDVLINKDGIKDRKLKLPKNLYIWATMNTSDQSLFPIDSAFKRRWEWVYQPIDTAKETWYVKVGEDYYSWTAFLNKVNDELLTDETAEDKHLGFYFCKATEKREGTEAKPNVITAETFVGKVLFYLWNDVFKVYGIPSSIGSSKDWPYRKFYQTNGEVDLEKVAKLMEQLKIDADAPMKPQTVGE